MGLTFWDTVRGVELAEILIHNLPKLSEAMERRQFTVSVPAPHASEVIVKAINDGASFVAEREGIFSGDRLLIFDATERFDVKALKDYVKSL